MNAAIREKVITASLNVNTARKMLAEAEAELDSAIKEAAKPSPFDGITQAAQAVIDKRPALPERHPVIIEQLGNGYEQVHDQA